MPDEVETPTPTHRIGVTVTDTTYTRLKGAALAARMPAASLGRTLIEHGLDRLGDPAVAAAVSTAADAERRRRSAAGSRGAQQRWADQ